MRSGPGVYRFGDFRLEVGERRLLRGDRVVSLTPKVFDTLVLLLENAGHLVPKERLLREIWPGLIVEEGNLTKNIWSLRKALGENPPEAAYIETVPKVGYRWIGPATPGTVADHESAAADSSAVVGAAPPPVVGDEPAVHSPDGLVDGAPAASAISPAVAAPDAARSASAGSTVPMRRTGSARLRRWMVVAAAAGVVAILLWVARRDRPVLASGSRRSIAVLGFRNLAPREGTDWLSTAATEMIGAELGAGESFRMIAADDVAREHVLVPVGALSADALARLRRRLGSDLVITGSYAAIAAPSDRLRFDVVVQDAASGETIAVLTQTGAQSEVLDLIASLGANLRRRLGLPPTTNAQSDSIALALPRDPEAARLYAEGIDHLRKLDARTAQDRLSQAAEKDPDNPLVRLALSRAWSALGFDDNARSEARRASENLGNLSGQNRLLVEVRLAEVEKNWERVVQLDHSLAGLFPDDLEYELKLASDQTSAGQARDALETVARIRRRPPPQRDDPRLDLAEAQAAGALSDFARALAAAHRAAEKASSQGRTGLFAQARMGEAAWCEDLGMADRGRAARREAERAYESDGDVAGLALTRVGIGNERMSVGDLDAATTLYEEALRAYEALGNKAGIASAHADLCLVDWFRGNTASARAHAETVLALRRETHDRYGTAWALNVLGNFLVEDGDFPGAARMHDEALSISREIGNRGYEGYSLDAIADAYRAEGRLALAEKSYRDALDIYEKIGDPAAVGGVYEDLGNVELDRGNLAQAESDYEKAVALQKKSGDVISVALVGMDLAQLRRAQGRNAEAVTLASEAVTEFEKERQPANLAISHATRARAELALARYEAASEDVRRAQDLVAQCRQNAAVFPVLLVAARAAAARGDRDSALSLSREARQRAEHARWTGYVLEARLVEAEIDLAGPRRQAAAAVLAAVGRDARSAGYLLLADEADRAARTGKAG